MTKMYIDIDEAARADAAEAYGTQTKEDTVNTALREGAARLRRARALAKLREFGDAGYFDVPGGSNGKDAH